MQRVSLRGVVPDEAYREMGSLVELAEVDAAAQEQLTRQAHATLGSPGDTPRGAWTEPRRAQPIIEAIHGQQLLGDDAATALARNRHVIPVPLGSEVDLPGRPFDERRWMVVGVGPSDRVQLGRAGTDGTVERATRRWSALVLDNPQLVRDHHLPVPGVPRALPLRLQPAGVAPGLPRELEQATHGAIASVAPRRRPYELVSTLSMHDGAPLVVGRGSWQELAARQRLTRLRPIPVMPTDAVRASELVELANPAAKRFVFASEANKLLDADLLAGVDALPARHRAAGDLAELDRISSFFERLGLRTWTDTGDQLVLLSGELDRIGNATAFATPSLAVVTTGPRDERVSRRVAALMGEDHAARADVRSSVNTLRRHWPAVLAHEVGHVATLHAWGTQHEPARIAADHAGDLATAARLAEHRVAEEAFSDLFGAAYARSHDIGARKLGALANGFGDLDQLRATIVERRLGFSGHAGTQLLTKPMLELQRARGWEAVAEVTASATNRLAALLGRGEITSIDVPTAARELRDAAAMRWGHEDDAVRAMTTAWQRLRVLL